MQRVSSNPFDAMKAAHLVHACMQVGCVQLSLTAQHPMHLQTLRRGAVVHRLDDGEQCRQLVIGEPLALRQARASAKIAIVRLRRAVRSGCAKLRLPHPSCNAWQQQRQQQLLDLHTSPNLRVLTYRSSTMACLGLDLALLRPVN